MQALRQAARTFTSQPAVTILAVVMLSLGIGASTAIFSMVNRDRSVDLRGRHAPARVRRLAGLLGARPQGHAVQSGDRASTSVSAQGLARVSLPIGLILSATVLVTAQDGDIRMEARDERSALAAFVAPYLGPDAAANVLVGIEARSAGGAESAGERLSLSLSLTDPVSSRALVERVVQVGVGGGLTTVPAPFLTEIPLPPGRYELRLREASGAVPSGVTAAVPPLVLPFEVPGPARPAGVPFSMSPLTLTSSAVGTPAAGDASEERRLFPLLLRPPSPRRGFAPGERVEVFAEIYDWDSEPGLEQQFLVRTSLRDGTGAVAYMVEEMGIAERLDSGRFGYAHSAMIPIATLAPGRYVVEVAVESLLTAASVARRAAITVIVGAGL